MNIDTNGEFKMNGSVEIVRGAYNFTRALANMNLVDKKFNVLPGSFITWNGDPLNANLDIKASYEQRASLAPIITGLDSTVLAQPEIKRRYTLRVLLGMKGSLMSPKISFGIDVADYPPVVVAGGVAVPLESYVQAFKEKIKNDEQELNRQVFSLIILKGLSPENAFSGAQTAPGSVSELVDKLKNEVGVI
jgi:hypothetical protein